jgi:hypothetical protein
MPGRWSGTPDLGGYIWSTLGFIFFPWLLLWSEQAREETNTASSNKAVVRGHLKEWSCCAAESLMAVRGGEGRSRCCERSAASYWWRQGVGVRAALLALEATFPGVPKRPTNRQAVIYGQGSHSELGCRGGPSFFFLWAEVLTRRIFIDLGKGSTTGVAPSGMFLAGSRALRCLL